MTTTALITGGTSGIGRAVANKLAELGVHVVVVGRNVKRGEKAIAEIRTAGGQADFISSDLRDASSAREVARRMIELGNGQIDILINNAGIYPFGLTHETSEELFDKVYSLTPAVALNTAADQQRAESIIRGALAQSIRDIMLLAAVLAVAAAASAALLPHRSQPARIP